MHANLITLDLENGASRKDLFRRVSHEISRLGHKHQIRIVPFRELDLPIFGSLLPERQEQILTDLQTYHQISQSTFESGGDLRDPVSSTWNAIKHLGLRPTSDLFTHIKDHNVIEIHDATGIQLFRNMNFYTYCSYSLEELYCFPWTHLYSRNEEVMKALMTVWTKVFSGEIKQTIPTHLPSHVIEELYSPFKLHIKADVNFLSPLFDKNGRAVASVVIERGQFDRQPPLPKDEERLLAEYVVPKNLLAPL